MTALKDFCKWLLEEEARAVIQGGRESRVNDYHTGFLHAIQDVKDKLMEEGLFDVDRD